MLGYYIKVSFIHIALKCKQEEILWKTLHICDNSSLCYGIFHVKEVFTLESLSAFCHTYAHASNKRFIIGRSDAANICPGS